ncbi:energy transducer TonB [Roseateles sp.]|uniref:energy transducer TonB n=1 Tax=Roseateles sp. TaxID=1971397 RepID=UPI0039E93F14
MELALPQRPDGSSHAVGFSVVVAVHLVIGYAIVSGLAQKVVDIVREPLEARLIDEVKPPPPPEPAKPPPKLLPKLTAPPPPTPYVPPPEVSVAAPANPAPTITATSPVLPPPAQEVRAAPPAPVPAPPPARSEPVTIGVVCPTQVAPVLPRRAQLEGITGQVRAQASIRGGRVVDVQILSSKPRGLFDAAVRAALLQYGCQSSGTDEIVAVQTFDFRAD